MLEDRKTKIVATLGPSTDPPGVLEAMSEAGMDCARLNFSHGTPDDHRGRAAAVRAAEKRTGRTISLMGDLPGSKLRLGDIDRRWVQAGELITFCSTRHVGSRDRIGVDYAKFPRLVSKQSELAIGDGARPRLAVRSISGHEVLAEVISPGELAPRKGIHVTHARFELPALTKKDLPYLPLAVELGVDFLALSELRSPGDMVELWERMAKLGWKGRPVGKYETVEAYERLDEILRVTRRMMGGMMVARGDGGVAAGLEAVPWMQVDMIRRATQASVFSVTATQMEYSMCDAPDPTRAESDNVQRAVWDGTSAVMLSEESATGKFPVAAVEWMAKHVRAAEKHPEEIRGRARPDTENPTSTAAAMYSAVDLAIRQGAVALIVPTATGDAVRECAKHRGPVPIIALADHPQFADRIARGAMLEWGVRATTMRPSSSVDELLTSALVRAKEFAGLRSGDKVVITAGGQPGVAGATNMIKVANIP